MGRSSYHLTRRRFLHLSGSAALAGMLGSYPLLPSLQKKNEHPNVLFIIVDDLRPDLGCYGNSVIKTPHIDSIADRGVVLRRAYCQQAICNPSRASVLTGKRPDSIKVWDQTTHFRKYNKKIVTLPQYFKKNGYKTVGIGKVFHPLLEDPPSWSVGRPQLNNKNIYVSPDTLTLQAGRVLAARALGKSDAWISTVMRGPAVEAYDAPDSQYLDGAVTEAALKKLQGFGKKSPFFLAVGYYKPHLPFVAPKKYWDLYRSDEIPPASNAFPPEGAPPFAINDMYELACYEGYAHISKATEGPLPEEKARILKHGYYACVSFIDAQIGALLAELDRLGLRENTIVVIWGDHGWKLGEHRAWCKQTNYEIDTRSPLIISAPQIKTHGESAQGIVELVDIYPTLCELAGLEIPQGLEGSSMAPLLREPDRAWKTAAFSQFPRGFQGRIMGYSLRTERYRYVEWRDWIDGIWIANEIYDHENDPDENVNIADRPENKGLVDELSRQLWGGWWNAIPKQ